jgi:predicted TPR repeat methyltransferase
MPIMDFDAAAQTFDEDFRIRRAKAVVAQLAEQVRLDRSMSALDFGCGTGLVGFELLPMVGRLTLADPSTGMIEQARKKIDEADADRVETLVLEAGDPDLPGPYDLIVSLMTLHHIPDAEGMIRILASSLTPGGSLAISDLDSEDGSFHGLDAEVHRGFERSEVRGWFRSAGLDHIRESTPWIMHKEVGGADREFPLFLITGRR